MIKGILFDLHGTLVDEKGNFLKGVPKLLVDLEDLGVRYAVLTNRSHSQAERTLRDLGLPDTPVVSHEATGRPKMGGGLHRAAAQNLGLDIREVVSVGDTKQDSVGAINAKVLPLGAHWGGGTPPYAVRLPSPASLIPFLKSFFFHEPEWFWSADDVDQQGRVVRMRALLPAGDRVDTTLYSLLKRVLKSDGDVRVKGADFRRFLNLYLLGMLYMDGLLDDTDVWTEYPPSSAATARAGPAALSRPATLLFRDQHRPDLITRHTPAPKSAYLRARVRRGGGSELPKFTNQTNSIHLNPAERAHVAGKGIVILDDFMTDGFSLDAARNYFLAGGAAVTTAVVFGRFGSSTIGVHAPKEGVVFDPFSPNSLDESDFEAKWIRGTYNWNALDQFKAKWDDSR